MLLSLTALGLLVGLVASAAPPPEPDYDRTIAAAHARAASATAARLRSAYESPIENFCGNCTSWNTEHGGIQGTAYPQAMAALYLNVNATRVAEAQLLFQQLAGCLAGPNTTARPALLRSWANFQAPSRTRVSHSAC